MMRHATGASVSSSSFEESTHNRHNFTSARNDLSRPYPSFRNVRQRSNQTDPLEDTFSDLFLCDFIIAHKHIARCKLDRLQLHPYQAALIQRGVQPQMDRCESYNAVLEASIGYTGACTAMVVDEMVEVNMRVDTALLLGETISDEVKELRGEVEALRGERQNLQAEMETLRSDRRELRDEMMEMREENAVFFQEIQSLGGVVNGLVAELGRTRDDLVRLTHRVAQRPTPLAAPCGRAEPAQRLVDFEGRLVPIENRVVEVIDLTSSDDDSIVPDSEEGSVRDFAGGEERQARDAAEGGYVTVDAEIRAARQDPAPEYMPAPEY